MKRILDSCNERREARLSIYRISDRAGAKRIRPQALDTVEQTVVERKGRHERRARAPLSSTAFLIFDP